MNQDIFSKSEGKFDIEGQAFCLDFANSLDWHASAKPVETLNSYSDLLQWGVEAGAISPEAAMEASAQSRQRPADAEHWLDEARTLREAIYRIFVAIVNGEPASPEDMEILSRFWQQAAQARRMVFTETGVRWEWNFRPDDLGLVLWPVAQSAVDLLESDQRERVGQCEDDRGCGFLFIDTSRNRSRRWCSMDSCGNRAKALRHYTRKK